MLWGKHPNYMELSHNTPWLKAISEHIPIVATVEQAALKGEFETAMPTFIDNKGVLTKQEYVELLRSSALLIGIGEPYWGNAPLDALEEGMMVLLPRCCAPPRRRSASVPGSWVVMHCRFHLSLFLTASRVSLPQDPRTDPIARCSAGSRRHSEYAPAARWTSTAR